MEASSVRSPRCLDFNPSWFPRLCLFFSEPKQLNTKVSTELGLSDVHCSWNRWYEKEGRKENQKDQIAPRWYNATWLSNGYFNYNITINCFLINQWIWNVSAVMFHNVQLITSITCCYRKNYDYIFIILYYTVCSYVFPSHSTSTCIFIITTNILHQLWCGPK